VRVPQQIGVARSAAVLGLVLGGGSVTTPTNAATASSATPVQVTSDGVQLSLLLPRRDYARNALVRLTIKITNQSQPGLTVAAGCGGKTPTVVVVRGDGTVAFPPVLPPPPLDDSYCRIPPMGAVPAGKSADFPVYAVLRARSISAAATVTLPGAAGSPATVLDLRTPSVQLSLRRGAPPSMKIVTTHGVHALVQGGSQALKPRRLFYTDWYRCRQPDGSTTIAGQTFYQQTFPSGPPLLIGKVLNWVNSGSKVLRPGCTNPLEWHVAAAWLNHPVATGDYYATSRWQVRRGQTRVARQAGWTDSRDGGQ
jgi:hypothetical protein